MRSAIDAAGRTLDIELSAEETEAVLGAPAAMSAFTAAVARECWRERLRSYVIWAPDGTMLAGAELGGGRR